MENSLSESLAKSRLFLIGQNHQGNWVAQDTRGQYGGLFANRADALRFALFENGHRPQAVIMVSGTFELDMSHEARASANREPLVRQAA
jgi:hypothetical protein